MALERWRGYLLDMHFIIKTDHFSLKYLLDQRITIPTQMKWLPKLIRYDYEVVYKKGSENGAADALSKLGNASELLSMFVSSITTDLMQRVKDIWTTDTAVLDIITTLQAGQPTKKHYSWTKDALLKKGKIMVGQDANLKTKLLQYFYESTIGGHSGVKVTSHKLCSLFYWKGMRKQVKKFVRECLVCQKCKPDLSAYPGLLQPLPIPNTIWSQIFMDFIEGIPKSQGKDVIMVVVDRLSKYAHFIGLSHPFTAAYIAQVFLDSIYKLHGLPESIVSDRDKVFISAFWKELFKVLKVKLLMSTAYHTQTDGQTEVVNRCLEGYLRCMTGEHPKEWSKWLPLAELWYNTNFHTSINTTPFEVVYGQTPPIHVPYIGGLSKVEAVDRSLLARENVIKMLKFHLQRSQNRMKQQADKSRTERQFEVGDMVFLKLQPHRQVTIRQGKQHKFSQKFYGPFEIIAKVGQVAYKLKLPAQAQIHDVFHISQLKKDRGPLVPMDSVMLPQCDKEGTLLKQPLKLLDRRIAGKGNRVVVYVVYGLVQWSNGTTEDASWEDLERLVKDFPAFDVSS
ncbi:retrotransposon-related protein [Tanacetum coccineum]|uniref:Retrotransposon-related protein n=1 Tax=Tanacetum coccineum TaxID=301880 RepID=A0ABQ5HUQ0_9ASTR